MFRFIVRIRLIVIDSPFIIDDSGFIKMSFYSPAIIVRAFIILRDKKELLLLNANFSLYEK